MNQRVMCVAPNHYLSHGGNHGAQRDLVNAEQFERPVKRIGVRDYVDSPADKARVRYGEHPSGKLMLHAVNASSKGCATKVSGCSDRSPPIGEGPGGQPRFVR